MVPLIDSATGEHVVARQAARHLRSPRRTRAARGCAGAIDADHRSWRPSGRRALTASRRLHVARRRRPAHTRRRRTVDGSCGSNTRRTRSTSADARDGAYEELPCVACCNPLSPGSMQTHRSVSRACTRSLAAAQRRFVCQASTGVDRKKHAAHRQPRSASRRDNMRRLVVARVDRPAARPRVRGSRRCVGAISWDWTVKPISSAELDGERPSPRWRRSPCTRRSSRRRQRCRREGRSETWSRISPTTSLTVTTRRSAAAGSRGLARQGRGPCVLPRGARRAAGSLRVTLVDVAVGVHEVVVVYRNERDTLVIESMRGERRGPGVGSPRPYAA